jgi:tetratricopeptide (TPR) repeat protein
VDEHQQPASALDALLQWEVSLWFEQGTFEQRLLLLQDGLRRFPDAAAIRVRLGHLLVIDDQQHQALEILSPLLDDNLPSISALAIAARAEAMCGNTTRAQYHLSRVQQLSPERFMGLPNLKGDVQVFLGNYEEAITAYEELAGDPSDANLLALIGRLGITWAHYRSGDFSRAATELTQAIMLWVERDMGLLFYDELNQWYAIPSIKELCQAALEQESFSELLRPEQRGVALFLLHKYQLIFSPAPSHELLLQAATLTRHPALGEHLTEYYVSTGTWDAVVTAHLRYERWRLALSEKADPRSFLGEEGYFYCPSTDDAPRVPAEQFKSVCEAAIKCMAENQDAEVRQQIYVPFYRTFLRQILLDGNKFSLMSIIAEALSDLGPPPDVEHQDVIYALEKLGLPDEVQKFKQRQQKKQKSEANDQIAQVTTEYDISTYTLLDPLNNSLWAGTKIIDHDGLRFRSRSEVRIYDALKRRRLLFIPNGMAVFGRLGFKREPDFLICKDGKWGILEVISERTHPYAARDHERARLFKDYGVRCIEFFDAEQCWKSPDGVVDQFLRLLDQQTEARSPSSSGG